MSSLIFEIIELEYASILPAKRFIDASDMLTLGADAISC